MSTDEIKINGTDLTVAENGESKFATELKGNILEISKEEHGVTKKAGLYLFNEDDAIALSNFQDEKYSSPEKFAEMTASIPDRFVVK